MKIKGTIHKLIQICALFLCTIVISACSKNAVNKNLAPLDILYIVTDLDDTYRYNLTEAILKASHEYGVSVDVVETHSSSAAEMKLVSEAKDKGYEAIICRIANNANAPQINSASNGLPIIYVNNQPAEEHLTSDKYIFVGSNEQQAGQYQAEYVISRLGTGAMNVVILKGEKDHSGTEGRTAAVKSTLQNHGVNANYVYVEHANWSYDEAAEKFQNFLEKGQRIDAVFCNNDLMALGVIDVMKKNNIDYTQIPVTGVDATREGCESIAAGEMAFSVHQDSSAQGKLAIEAAVLLAEGNSIRDVVGASTDQKYIWVDFEPVSSSNVKKLLDMYYAN